MRNKNWKQWIGLVALILVFVISMVVNRSGDTDNQTKQPEPTIEDYAEIIENAEIDEGQTFIEADADIVIDEEPDEDRDKQQDLAEVVDDRGLLETDVDDSEITDEQANGEVTSNTVIQSGIAEDGTYSTKDEVAAYIHEYGHLPSNYITKQEAEDLGWISSKGNLSKVAPGKSIGGNKFGNYEGLLPEKKGRKYYECDIDYSGGKRNAKRIIFSNDGLIFYTEDHYETFEQLYE